jgi:hypothetical protein
MKLFGDANEKIRQAGSMGMTVKEKKIDGKNKSLMLEMTLSRVNLCNNLFFFQCTSVWWNRLCEGDRVG